jgi:hypothetical protein
MPRLQATIDIAAIGNNRQSHPPLPVVYLIDDSVITNANAVYVAGPLELFAPARPRILRKCNDPRVEPV